MTPQIRSLLLGGAVTAGTRFYFKQPWCLAIIAGLGAIVILDFATEPAK